MANYVMIRHSVQAIFELFIRHYFSIEYSRLLCS